ncbi:LysR substrate-binding domain-containing protein [Halomonas sp. MC140]|nr:LysR substrate-binding domain-containing protein [Halomonas sp. MC140]MDN7131222.1 LysR substrate-binding domain-containing protein [Halomonas sp. MC140]
MIPFRNIAVFFHVARIQSVTGAAEHLNITSSAVSQQLRSLEEHLGTTLVVKSGRALRLTEAGEHYFDLISEDIEHLIKVTEQIKGIKTLTRINIRATPTIATKWLLPRLGEFLSFHPDLEVRLDGSNEPTDFSRERVDIEIRHGTGRWPGLYVQPLITEYFIPVCSPALALPASLTPNDFKNYRLIHSVKAQVQWRNWFASIGSEREVFPGGLYFDRSHMSVDAATLGLGIALESNLMMEGELKTGKLIIPSILTPEMPVCTQWIVCPNQSLRLPQVRRFVEWIQDKASQWSRENISQPFR